MKHFVLYPSHHFVGTRIYTEGYKTLNTTTVAWGVLCTVPTISVRLLYKPTQHYILEDKDLNTESSENLHLSTVNVYFI